ncbi:MAG: 4-(cytidine 5'-diphospho)-2-C-methyl-D-erythritol kinase, partial [Lachnospiraceae bacterium]
IAKPSISVSTQLVYQRLDSYEIVNHPNIDAIVQGLKCKNLEQIAASMGNVLERVTIEEYPIIEQIKKTMKAAGALNAMMSGSGPTVFGIFQDRKTAKIAQQMIKEENLAKQVYLTNVHNARRK